MEENLTFDEFWEFAQKNKDNIYEIAGVIAKRLDVNCCTAEQLEKIAKLGKLINVYLKCKIFYNKTDLTQEELNNLLSEMRQVIQLREEMQRCMTRNKMDYTKIFNDIMDGTWRDIKYDNLKHERAYILINNFMNSELNMQKDNIVYGNFMMWVMCRLFSKDNYDNKEIKRLIDNRKTIEIVFCKELDREELEFNTIEKTDIYYDTLSDSHVYMSYEPINFSKDNLKELYDKHRDIIINTELDNELYIRNCLIFAEFLSKEEKISLINKVIEYDELDIIHTVLNLDKLSKFLNDNIDIKDRLEASLIMLKLAK